MASTRKRKRRRKAKPLNSFIVAFAFTALVIYLFITSFSACVKISDTEDKISAAKTQYEELNSKNEETEKLLKNADENDIIERIARERLGYVFPDEKIYYDVN